MPSRYAELHARSLSDPESFWADAAEAIHWTKRWERVLDDSNPPSYRWFTGGELNTCYNALDLHVENGRGDQAALIYDSPVTDTGRRYTYAELRDEVACFAGVLAGLGVGRGDRVIVYMPMVPEAIIAMLACARLGAVHSVVFGGFASSELAMRIDDATPVAIVSASCGVEPGRVVEYKPLLDGAIELAAHKPRACVILQREGRPLVRSLGDSAVRNRGEDGRPPARSLGNSAARNREGEGRPPARSLGDSTARNRGREGNRLVPCELVEGRDVDWAEAMRDAEPHPCVPVAATDPLYILYTSGTTGQPKGVVRDNGGHAVALKWTMKHIYGVEPGEVYWAASDVGWVVGHSYICYAPLLNGNTTIVYEGKPVGTPDAGAFWRVLSEYGVSVLFTAPTAFRAIKQQDPEGTLIGRYDLGRFRTLFLAGERLDPDTLRWAQSKLGVPVIDHWWQTETGWSICANCIGIEALPIKEGSPSMPAPGMDVQAVDDHCAPVPAGEIGALVVKLPLPPGTLPTLWNAEQRFRDAYLAEFPGYYKTGDAGFIDEDGYVFVMTRTDDVINVAGHRLSTGAMEEVLTSHPDVAECAVIGVADALKGQLPLGFLVLNAGCGRAPDEICNEVVKLVREKIGPVAAFKTATVVQRLPKTRSGKILRGTMQKIADGDEWKMPATIDDPEILGEITGALRGVGYAGGG